MAWEIEFTDEFETWWNSLSERAQIAVRASVNLLREFGPSLDWPHSSQIMGMSKRDRSVVALRELRVQSQGHPYRVLYAFDPRRFAILLVGGDKTGQDRWYEIHVPLAVKLYREYIQELKTEGEIPE